MKRTRSAALVAVFTVLLLLILSSCGSNRLFYQVDTKINGYLDFGDTAAGGVLPTKTKNGWILLDASANRAVTDKVYQSLKYHRDGLFTFSRDGIFGHVAPDGTETDTVQGTPTSIVPYSDDSDFIVLKTSYAAAPQYDMLDTKSMKSYPLIGNIDRMDFPNENLQKSYGIYRVFQQDDAGDYIVRSYLYPDLAAKVTGDSVVRYDIPGYIVVQSPLDTLYYSVRSGAKINAAEWTRIPSEHQTLFYSIAQNVVSIWGDFTGKIRLTPSSPLATVDDLRSVSAIGAGRILIGLTLYALEQDAPTFIIATDVRRDSNAPVIYRGFDGSRNEVYFSETLTLLPSAYLATFTDLGNTYHILQDGIYDDRFQIAVQTDETRAFRNVSDRYFALTDSAEQDTYYRKDTLKSVCKSYGQASVDTVNGIDYFTVKTNAAETQSALLDEDGIQILFGNTIKIIAPPHGVIAVSGYDTSNEPTAPLRVTAAADLMNRRSLSQSQIDKLYAEDGQNGFEKYAFFSALTDVYSFANHTLLISETGNDTSVFDTATNNLYRFAGAYLAYYTGSNSILLETPSEYVSYSLNTQMQLDSLSFLEYRYEKYDSLFFHRMERTVVFVTESGNFSAPALLPQDGQPQVFGDSLLVSSGGFFCLLSSSGRMQSDYRYIDAALLGNNLIVLTDRNRTVEIFDGALNKILSNVIFAKEIAQVRGNGNSFTLTSDLFYAQTKDGKYTLIRATVLS